MDSASVATSSALICLTIWTLLAISASQADGGYRPDASTPSRMETTVEDESLRDLTASSVISAILNNTDPRLRPQAGGPPVEVACDFFVTSIDTISEVSMDYQLNIFLRQYWRDNRVTYTGPPGSIVLNAKATSQMWTPDIYFINEKKASFHDVTVPNKRMSIFPNGSIVYSIRLSLTLSCPMDLSHFPMDEQFCKVGMESYAYDRTEMTLKWSPEAVEENPGLELPQFTMVDVNSTAFLHHYHTGDFACLEATFTLKRQYGFYLLQTYVPSVLIVVLSWVAFWINKDAVPARISLSVTTVLTMATQLSGSKSSIPKVSYPKAIDVWMSACMFFVFAALLEYAFVNTLSRKAVKVAERAKRKEQQYQKVNEGRSCENNARKQTKRAKADISRLLDKLSRWMFPASFLCFNIIYWSIYLA